MKKILRIALCLCLLAMMACGGGSRPAGGAYVPQTGDLLFVVADASAFSGAIADATARRDSLRFSHVAVVGLQEGQPYVVEASSRSGVVRTAWNAFFLNVPKIDGRPGVVAMRVVEDSFPTHEALARAESHIGEAYDWSFLPHNGKMYCSELVYESYLRNDGRALFSARPMNFRDAEGNMPAFWLDLFEKLGEPIPEGLPGTNPNDLAKEPSLVEVWRGF